MGLIEIEGVTFTYAAQPDHPALQNLTCRIERGSFVGIAGPSDAGKSSLCRLVAGYVPHFFDGELSGSVSVDGVDTGETTVSELAGKVGVVFENPFDQLTGASTTVLEEVAFGLENMGLPRDKILRRARESLELVGISGLTDRSPLQLSGGQSQRLALASALAMRSEVLILDEPTSQLDPLGAEEVLEAASEMHRQGYTVIVVSQDLERLAPRAGRLILLEKGRIVADGKPAEVFSEVSSNPKVPVPDTVEVGRRLRDAGLISPETPPPMTVEDAAEELASALEGLPAGPPPETSAPLQDPKPVDAPARISLEDVRHAYAEDVQTLRGVSLELDEGCVCIVGQNGAGKTTLMKHLNGLLKPAGGRVLVGGMDTQEHRVARLAREVGLAFQNPDDQLFSGTVEEEVRFGAVNVGASPEEAGRQVDEALRLLGLEEVRHKKPYDLGLSGRKRVAIASVVAMGTQVVVLDEPTGGQDAEGIGLLGEVVRHLVGEGRLVIVVTHDLRFAGRHAGRVIALHEGRVLLDGTPREVFGREEELARTHLLPPEVTRLGRRLGLDHTVLEVDELFRAVGLSQHSAP